MTQQLNDLSRKLFGRLADTRIRRTHASRDTEMSKRLPVLVDYLFAYNDREISVLLDEVTGGNASKKILDLHYT